MPLRPASTPPSGRHTPRGQWAHRKAPLGRAQRRPRRPPGVVADLNPQPADQEKGLNPLIENSHSPALVKEEIYF